MSRTLWPLATLAVIAVIVAGCGDGSAGSGGGNSNSNSTAAIHKEAVKFAECMRDNGVGAFPDPNASGELTIDAVANGSSLRAVPAPLDAAVTHQLADELEERSAGARIDRER